MKFHVKLNKHKHVFQKTDTIIENVKVRIYKTKNSIEKEKPIMIYYHGGGYTFGVINIQILKII